MIIIFLVQRFSHFGPNLCLDLISLISAGLKNFHWCVWKSFFYINHATTVERKEMPSTCLVIWSGKTRRIPVWVTWVIQLILHTVDDILSSPIFLSWMLIVRRCSPFVNIFLVKDKLVTFPLRIPTNFSCRTRISNQTFWKLVRNVLTFLVQNYIINDILHNTSSNIT